MAAYTILILHFQENMLYSNRGWTILDIGTFTSDGDSHMLLIRYSADCYGCDIMRGHLPLDAMVWDLRVVRSILCTCSPIASLLTSVVDTQHLIAKLDPSSPLVAKWAPKAPPVTSSCDLAAILTKSAAILSVVFPTAPPPSYLSPMAATVPPPPAPLEPPTPPPVQKKLEAGVDPISALLSWRGPGSAAKKNSKNRVVCIGPGFMSL